MCSLAFVVFTLCVAVLPFEVLCEDQENEERVLRRTLSEKLFNGYKKDFLPRLNESVPVKVQFDFELITIKDVNAKEQTFTVYGWVRQKWHNPFLEWNSSEFGGIQSIQTNAEKIWVPDVLVYNNIDLHDRIGGGRTTYQTSVLMQANGQNSWMSPAIFKTVCAIDVTFFPFDMQTCLLKFGSWASNSQQITLCPQNMTGQSNQYVDNGEWDIIDIIPRRNVVHYSTGAFDDVTITIVIGRVFFVYCVNLIIPCFLISTMIFLGFILPPECGERIGLSITVLLAMTVFQQLTANIFPSFDFPLLGQYYFATSVEISISLLATTVVLNFTNRKNKKMPRWMRKLLLEWTARVVFLRKTVEKSCPKPKHKRSTRRFSSMREFRDNQEARQRGTAGHDQMITRETFPDDPERQDDHLVAELKSMFMISKNLDYGGLRYAHSVKSTNLNGLNNGDDSLILSGPTSEGVWDDSNMSFTGVLDENGEELEENELQLRQWEWIMAARVLDRALLWVSIIAGIVTFFAIFMRAPRLQTLLFGS